MERMGAKIRNAGPVGPLVQIEGRRDATEVGANRRDSYMPVFHRRQLQHRSRPVRPSIREPPRGTMLFRQTRETYP